MPKYEVKSAYDEEVYEAFDSYLEAAEFADGLIGERMIPSVEVWVDGELKTTFKDGRYEKYIKPFVLECVEGYFADRGIEFKSPSPADTASPLSNWLKEATFDGTPADPPGGGGESEYGGRGQGDALEAVGGEGPLEDPLACPKCGAHRFWQDYSWGCAPSVRVMPYSYEGGEWKENGRPGASCRVKRVCMECGHEWIA